MNRNVEAFISKQLDSWELAKENYAAFDNDTIKEKRVTVESLEVKVQCNPARIRSSAADIRPSAISSRPCFLCRKNRPSGQEYLPWGEYDILVNPYPIFRKHLVISAKEHAPQSVDGHCGDLFELVDFLGDAVVFYNGAKCGASAPDHFHFQACPTGELPLEVNWRKLPRTRFSIDLSSERTEVFLMLGYLAGAYVMESDSREDSVSVLRMLMDTMPPNLSAPDSEPMVNILSWKEDGKYVTVMVPRAKHRPDTFGRFTVTPACVELGGVIITPKEEDWDCLGGDEIAHILKDVCVPFRQPQVKVGLLSAPELMIEFASAFKYKETVFFGPEQFKYEKGKVLWRGKLYERLDFIPVDEKNGCFSMIVKIGIAFHWERNEKQVFQGGVTIVPVSESVPDHPAIISPGSPGMLTVINRIGVEDYLVSVISSEMNSAAPTEFLRAHAIISRSWLMNKINGVRKSSSICPESDGDNISVWYGQDDHSLFDVCADDHCQRYQGIVRVRSKAIAQVINDTWGQVLKYDGQICDARYSKCCGGVSEQFENCWQDEHFDYLSAVRDTKNGILRDFKMPDLTMEENAREWILSSPESFCNTSDRSVLTTVLNNYDQETTDFFRWNVSYTQKELSELVRLKSGIDFGEINEMVPLKRGQSGRITKLKIIGTRKTVTVGKELEIRRWLSKSHLYSSAFIVEKKVNSGRVSFTLYGAGWGHGVGLCQIGAAVMGCRGYSFKEILLHYFRGASIEKLY